MLLQVEHSMITVFSELDEMYVQYHNEGHGIMETMLLTRWEHAGGKHDVVHGPCLNNRITPRPIPSFPSHYYTRRT